MDTHSQMLRAKLDILQLLISSERDGPRRRILQREIDGVDLAQRTLMGRLSGQVTTANEDEWRRSQEDKLLEQRMREEEVKFRVDQDMDLLKKKRRILNCILHDYIPDPKRSIVSPYYTQSVSVSSDTILS